MIINELPKTYSDAIYPQLPFLIRAKKRNIKVPERFGNNPSGQLKGLAFTITELFKKERIVLNYSKATEIRPHAERLIVEAMRNGDRHRQTMALANFWLLDKQLIHKLFKELVPRYSDYNSAFTALHMLGGNYEILSNRDRCYYKTQAVLELRGNNLPPITRPKLNKSGLLTNVLISAAAAEADNTRRPRLRQ